MKVKNLKITEKNLKIPSHVMQTKFFKLPNFAAAILFA